MKRLMDGIKNINKTLLITILLLMLTIISGTFAWFTYQSKQSSLVLAIGDINAAKLILKPYQIRGTMTPVNSYTGGVYTQIQAINNNNSAVSMVLYYNFNELSSALVNNGLTYTITESSSLYGTYTVITTGDFTNLSTGDIIFEREVAANTTKYYRVYLWLDSNVGDQTLIQGETLDLELNGRLKYYVPEPKLDSGMIPVTISNDGTVKTILSDDPNWYDYDNKKWANAVLVTSSSRSTYLNTSGVTIPESNILGYFVWIPRFKYKIWNVSGDDQSGNEQEIDIVFETNGTPKSTGTTVGSYRTHPAFTFGTDELSGFWVGKFETTGTSSSPTVKPNLQSLRSQNVSTQFQTALKFAGGTLSSGNVSFAGSTTYGLSSLTNSHMMKNSEWGAVAYLSHSKYGVNREIYINNSSGRYTGRSGGNVSGSTPINGTYTDQTSTTQYNTYGFYNWKGCLLSYNTNTETTTCDITKVASTTGNITGVYDMSGGAWEHTMGVFANSSGQLWSGYTSSSNSGFTGLLGSSGTSYEGIAFPPDKYYDVYRATNGTTISNITACDGGVCFGHALSETAGWYSDNVNFVSSGGPWFIRGGGATTGVGAGIFESGGLSGYPYNNRGFRVVLLDASTHTVSYNANGGNGAPSSQTVMRGESLTLSSTIPTRTGYTFLGWSTSSAATSATYSAGATITPTADMMLYAVWRANTYTINYDANLFSNVTDRTANGITVSYDESTSYLTLNGSLTDSMTFAQFTYQTFTEGDKYKITLEYVSGSYAKNDSNTATLEVSGEDYTNLSTRNKIDLSFPTSGSVSGILTISSLAATDGRRLKLWTWTDSSTTATPVFTNYVVKVNVTKVSTLSINYGSTYTAPSNPTRMGHTFSGWTTNADGTDDGYDWTNKNGTWTYTNGQYGIVNNKLNLYAMWEANTYTISYNANGGSGAPSSQTKTYGVNLTLRSTKPTRTGYTFLGWSTSSTATSATYQPGGTFATNANTTLYAVWRANTYTISYNANGGRGAPSSQTKTHGVNLTLRSTKPTRTGYKFLGWSLSSTATSATYQPGGTFTRNANTTLYAVWRAYKVTIKYNVNHGTVRSRTTGTDGTVYNWTTDSDGLIYRRIDGGSSTIYTQSVNYGSSFGSDGIVNYNNNNFLYILLIGYTAESGAEWGCIDGDCTFGRTYSQTTAYSASDFCDASNGDCEVILGVNWDTGGCGLRMFPATYNGIDYCCNAPNVNPGNIGEGESCWMTN